MSYTIHHRPKQSRFETEVDGHSCVLDYRLEGDIASMNSVRVPKPVEGRGIAGSITRAALDHARAAGWRVIPNCPYVRTWIDRHPDYADLLAE